MMRANHLAAGGGNTVWVIICGAIGQLLNGDFVDSLQLAFSIPIELNRKKDVWSIVIGAHLSPSLFLMASQFHGNH
jgi:hypothetical protein